MTYDTYRNRHLRGEEDHFGDLTATLVEFSEAIGASVSPGMTLEGVIAQLDSRLHALESGNMTIRTFRADAFIKPHLTIDACVFARLQASFAMDAIAMPLFRADAFIGGYFRADAYMVTRKTGSLLADARLAGTFRIDAAFRDPTVQLGFVDDKDDVFWVTPPPFGSPLVVPGDFASFTLDATDPFDIGDWASTGPLYPHATYTGWVGLVTTETVRLRIHALGSAMVDTLLAIWGPRESPPTYVAYQSPGSPQFWENEAWHLSDDSGLTTNDRYQSSLHDRGQYPLGTLYHVPGESNWADGWQTSDDTNFSGILVEPGLYWICLWPYDNDEWDHVTENGPTFITIIRVAETQSSFSIDAKVASWFTADAILYQPSFTADAVLYQPTFTIDAQLKKVVTVDSSVPTLTGIGLSPSAGDQYNPYQSSPSFTHLKLDNTPADECLLVFTRSYTNGIPTTMTYGGRAMTKVAEAYYYDRMSLWYLDDLSGLPNKTISMNGSSIYALSFSFGGRSDVSLRDSDYLTDSVSTRTTTQVSLTSAAQRVIAMSMASLTASATASYIIPRAGDTYLYSVLSSLRGTASKFFHTPRADGNITTGFESPSGYNPSIISALIGTDDATLAIKANAFIRPYFTVDAVLTMGGYIPISAFVQPWFTVDAEVYPMRFWADATIELPRDPLWDYAHDDDGPFTLFDGPSIARGSLMDVYRYERNK